MHRRALPTIATACLLYGAYTLYSLFLTPLFSPPALSRPDLPRLRESKGVRRNSEQARRYLPDEPWAADAKYQVRRDDTYMYAGEWEKVESTGEVRFAPFAIIWHREDEASGEPIVVVSDSARLQFEEPFDERNFRPGRIVGGALEGAVRIRGADGLKVNARNVQFSESAQRLWSDSPLTFAYGPHSGNALGLELDLIPGTPEGDKPAITGVRTVRLRRDVEMNLVQPAQNGKPAETVIVRSAGMFEYHVDERHAVFQRKVHVEHPVGPGQVDTLDGELLTLFLEPSAGVSPDRKPGTIESNLELRRIRAEGVPAVLVSPRSDVQARSALLIYEVPGRTARLTDANGVQVIQKTTVLRSPDVTLTHAENGDVVRAVALGPGQLDGHGSTPQAKSPIAFQAAWQTDLTIEPDPDELLNNTPLTRITLRGQALARQPGEMLLRGDELTIWVAEQPEEPGRTSVQPDRSSRGEGDRFKARPRRMLATGAVHFEGVEFSGDTKRLTATFEDGTLPISRSTVRAANSSSRQPFSSFRFHRERADRVLADRDRGAARLTEQGFANVPVEIPPRSTKPKPGKPKFPSHIVADEIRLRIIQDGEKTDVAEVWNDGNVKVTQPRDNGDPPFELRGDHLHLLKFSDVDQVVHLVGGPALIKDRGFEIEGADLHLDRGRNSAHVQGAGRLRLPVRNSPDGKPLATPRPLDVRWTEQMTFNGQTAVFLAGVVATMAEHRMTCEQMQVRLVKPVRLAAESLDDQKPELQTIHCQENVEVLSREIQAGRVVSVSQAKAWEFTLNQVTGATLAKGPPGTLKTWRPAGEQRGRLALTAGVQANKPLQTDSANWEFTRIDFAGTMTGNTRERSTTFAHRVLVVHGPVEQLGQSVDPDDLPRDGAWMQCERLKLTQHAESELRPSYLEMLGEGNATLRGRPGRSAPLEMFHALADSISFDESKGMYMLRSGGTRDATLWRQTRPGTQPHGVPAKRMEFFPATGRFKVHQASGLDVLE